MQKGLENYMGKSKKQKFPCRKGQKITWEKRGSANPHEETDKKLQGKIEKVQIPMKKQIKITGEN